MGITNPVHLLFIAIIALVVLGPKRLPDLARSLGEGMRQFRESLETASHPEHEDISTAAMIQSDSPQATVAATGFPSAASSPHGTVSPPPDTTPRPAGAPADSATG